MKILVSNAQISRRLSVRMMRVNQTYCGHSISFFKGKTDHALLFNFDMDYNSFAPIKINKAKEIIVELIIELADTYKRDGYSEYIVWRKVWRTSGLHLDGCFYRYTDKQEFPARSRIPNMLEKIVYNYVPAIKDKDFFTVLQGQVYDVLQTVAEKNLRKSASSFESEIQGHLKDLLSSVSEVFHSVSDMRMPANLRQVFENLEFNSDGIPLFRRGDGIKVRHIPMILRFIAEKRNSIHKQGISHHIWGFEEPENNVEMASCFEMAEQFLAASVDEYQIFITTHSPVFYGLSEANKEQVKAYSVAKIDHYSVLQELNKQVADHEMGLMQIVTPYVNKERESWLTKKQEIEVELEQLRTEKDADKKLPHIFVEGKTDEQVLQKAITVFFPALVNNVKIHSGGNDGYGSAEAATSRAIAWQLTQQHNLNPVKGILILDKDDAGVAAKKRFEENVKDKSKHIQAHHWKIQGKPLGIDVGFNLPIDLEFLYADAVWETAEKNNWLEDLANPGMRLTKVKKEQVVANAFAEVQPDLFGGVEQTTQRRIKKQFSVNGKTKAAKWLNECNELVAKTHLSNFEPTLKEIFQFFELPN